MNTGVIQGGSPKADGGQEDRSRVRGLLRIECQGNFGMQCNYLELVVEG